MASVAYLNRPEAGPRSPNVPGISATLALIGVAMAPDHQDRSAIQAWLIASNPFLLHEGSGLTILALLDLLDAGHQAAAPIAVTWIEGRLQTLLGQLREEGSLEPWKVLVHGASHGIWGLYLHNMPTSMAFLAEFPPKSRAAFINRANFLRLSQELADLASHPAERSQLRKALVAQLSGLDGSRAERLREVYPEEFIFGSEPSMVRESTTGSAYRADQEQPGPAQVVLAAQEELAESEGAFDPNSIEDARERVMATIVRRRGQHAFREALIQRYDGRCLVTGCDVVAVLEAAHIIPYHGTETNHPENGLLLRADIHTLFDLGLLSVDDEHRVILHPSLHAGSHGALHGQRLQLSNDPQCHPSRAALLAHRSWAGLDQVPSSASVVGDLP